MVPESVRAAVEEAIGCRIDSAIPVSGGMIHQAARLDTSRGPFFVKWNHSPSCAMFEAESVGLSELRAARVLRVPHVVAVGDSGAATDSFLLLEYIEQRPSANPVKFAERFGQQLAEQHGHQTQSPRFGFRDRNFIGRLPQLNEWRESWADFYREQRIQPQVSTARAINRLPAERERLVRQVCEILPRLLTGLNSRPSLLHGDLWSGNYLTAGDDPVVVDPAVYYGEREMEIAFMELFDGFPARVFESYREAFPLQPGYEFRRPLHQLYPLLVHLNHFGEPYGQDVDRVCRQYLD